MNTKYDLSNVLKTSEFSRVCSTSENSDVFNSRDEMFLVFTPQKSKFSFLFYTFNRLHALSHPLKMQKNKKSKQNRIDVNYTVNHASSQITIIFLEDKAVF